MTVAIPLWAIIAAMAVVIVWLAFWVEGLRVEVRNLKGRMRSRLQDLLADPAKAAVLARHWQKYDEAESPWVSPNPPPPPPPRKKDRDDGDWRRIWEHATGPVEKPQAIKKGRSKVPPRPIPRPADKKRRTRA